MCESHVSNPQTVGKCCSLLNSLLPPSLFPSMPPSLALSFCWTALQASALPCRNPVRVCVHASVCARACLPRSTQEVSTERLPAQLRLELPLPADGFYANTNSSTTHTHRRAHTHKLAASSTPCQEQPRRPKKVCFEESGAAASL